VALCWAVFKSSSMNTNSLFSALFSKVASVNFTYKRSGLKFKYF
jgi:hypothetical protein